MEKNQLKKNIKKRNWAFVLYPESAPEDWISELQNTGLQCAISPLHNMDVNPTGELKKEHYHVILCYSGPTSYNVVKQLTETLNQPIPQALEQIRGYWRYFTHKDNPDKYQYSEQDITLINGFCIDDYVQMSSSEEDELLAKIETIVITEKIIELLDLTQYLRAGNFDAELRYLRRHTYYIESLIKSQRNSLCQKSYLPKKNI